ncbi:hypothetical protein KGF56_003744 [Candida oxycetoniae]|uniref:G-patch domain-containing protein n=1 Tax=Candida oxycetoniae TaxID=497107 RepID=A0AAI9WX74_9ASCO|nr:uncharacterized protein KGF56_003744 [Candida oxycetoniae]KAI3403460.2 hypothetical protein KGF56_003744 [Candida oxycetoniae]
MVIKETNPFDESDSDDEDCNLKKSVAFKKKPFTPVSTSCLEQVSEHLHRCSFQVEEKEDYKDYNSYDEYEILGSGNDEDIEANCMDKSLFETSPHSIGFKIMRKFGFTVGDSLGLHSNSNALKEPLGVDQLSGYRRRGLGMHVGMADLADWDIEERKMERINLAKKNANLLDISNKMKLCFELSGEFEEFLDHGDLNNINPLWRPYAEFYKSLKNPSHSKSKKTFANFCRYTRARNDSLDKYLRDIHRYCWYCCYYLESQDDHLQDCPLKTDDETKSACS